MEGCRSSTRGGEKGSGQLAVDQDVFDFLVHIYQPPHYWRDSPITQNPAERVEENMRTKTSRMSRKKNRMRKNKRGEGEEKDL